MNMQRFMLSYRSFFGLLGLVAVITEIIVLLQKNAFVPDNFFSYFTVISNIFAGCVLLAMACGISRHVPLWNMIRGAATLYMIMTGVIFALLLSNLQGVAFTVVPWDNVVLHYIMPVVLLVDWLLDPPKPILLQQAVWWLIMPIAYVVYSLVRGAMIGWYPYPFLNPAGKGYGTVIVTCALFSIGVVVAAFALQQWTRVKNKSV